MYQQNDKRAVICGIAILPVADIGMVMMLGKPTVSITGTGGVEYMRVQGASFSEKRGESGDYVEQEFECVFTDTSPTGVYARREYVDQDVIVLVRYSHGEVRVIGTAFAPVRLNEEESGSPMTVKVSFKRKSPEFAKFLQSLN